MPVVIMPAPARSQPSAYSSLPKDSSPNPAGRPAVSPVRRRGSASQGRALEALGHAVEYLIDSRLFTLNEAAAASDAEAAQLLMRLSRNVFAECPEVISLNRRMRLWLVQRFSQPVQAGDGW